MKPSRKGTEKTIRVFHKVSSRILVVFCLLETGQTE